MSEFLTIGEPLAVFASSDLDASLSEATHFQKFLAGAELNVAIGLSRLGHSTQYISQIGQDFMGDFIAKGISKHHVGTTYLKRSADFHTGFYFKEQVSNGDPKVEYFRKNSAASHYKKENLNEFELRNVKIAHLSGIMAAISDDGLATVDRAFDLFNDLKITTVFDPNLRPSLWESKAIMIEKLNQLAKKSKVVLPGINEGEMLIGSKVPEQIADFYLSQSEITSIVVVKLGVAGAYLKTKEGYEKTIKGFKVTEVVDTVGAGDGFAVGFESALLEGLTLDEAAERACAIGALAVQSLGDNDGYPTRTALEQFLAEAKR
ncbi:sugar kinase [Lactococcus lactis]|uniref:sugar kinase n=1 Tax=Lactococcus lactis TaxID=1358 RepID=UPI0021A4F257|nr:sugar kinase [Lactococcus lactis]MCT3091796.1 sugar kinase [Lactococcus lactis]